MSNDVDSYPGTAAGLYHDCAPEVKAGHEHDTSGPHGGRWGDHAGALPPGAVVSAHVASPFFSLASQRYLRAELLRETGRPEEAAGSYSIIAQRSPYELIYAAPARQRMAEMAPTGPLSR